MRSLPGKLLKRRANKNFEGDKSRDGIPWQPEEWNAMIFSKCQRLAGAHVHFPEIQFTIRFDSRLDVIECTHTDAGRGDDNVSLFGNGSFQLGPDVCFRIRGNT